MIRLILFGIMIGLSLPLLVAAFMLCIIWQNILVGWEAGVRVFVWLIEDD